MTMSDESANTAKHANGRGGCLCSWPRHGASCNTLRRKERGCTRCGARRLFSRGSFTYTQRGAVPIRAGYDNCRVGRAPPLPPPSTCAVWGRLPVPCRHWRSLCPGPGARRGVHSNGAVSGGRGITPASAGAPGVSAVYEEWWGGGWLWLVSKSKCTLN